MKVSICLSIEKNDLIVLQRKSKEYHRSVQELIRDLIKKQLKKIENAKK